MTDAICQGAVALHDLIRRIAAVSDATCDGLGDAQGDGRDYVAMVQMVEASIRSNVSAAGAEHREGYLRALAHLLCLVADGAGPTATWNPLGETAAAFAASTEAGRLLVSASGLTRI